MRLRSRGGKSGKLWKLEDRARRRAGRWRQELGVAGRVGCAYWSAPGPRPETMATTGRHQVERMGWRDWGGGSESRPRRPRGAPRGSQREPWDRTGATGPPILPSLSPASAKGVPTSPPSLRLWGPRREMAQQSCAQPVHCSPRGPWLEPARFSLH